MASSGLLTLLKVDEIVSKSGSYQLLLLPKEFFVVVVGGGLILIQGDLPIKLIIVSFSGCCAQDMDMGVNFGSMWLSCLYVVVMGLLPR